MLTTLRSKNLALGIRKGVDIGQFVLLSNCTTKKSAENDA
jgi:hypothetical protein